jgi:hypothetical protein
MPTIYPSDRRTNPSLAGILNTVQSLASSNLGATTIVVGETPGGLVNGSNTIYTTSDVFSAGSLQVFKNGIRLTDGGGDYSTNASNNGFTMVTAPATGTILRVCFYKVVNFNIIGTNSFITDETPTGTVNGSNTAFTVLKLNYIAGSLNVYLNGQKLTHTADFTETTPASGTFAFVTAPATGAVVRVDYQFNQNASGNADTIDGYHVGTGTSGVIPVSPVPINQTALGTYTAPTVYTPSWTAAGTAPDIGNGTIVGRYTQIGKTVFGNIYLGFGTTTTAGTGSWYFTFPVTAESTIKRVLIGNAAMVDAGVQEVDGATLLLIDTTKFAITKADGTLWGVGVPLTLGATDYVHIAFQFEAA